MKDFIIFCKSYFREIIFALAVFGLMIAMFLVESLYGLMWMLFVFLIQRFLLESWRFKLEYQPEEWLRVYPRLCVLAWSSNVLLAGSAVAAHYSPAQTWNIRCLSIGLPILMLIVGIGSWYLDTDRIRSMCKALRQMPAEEIAQEKQKLIQARQELENARKKMDEARKILEHSPFSPLC